MQMRSNVSTIYSSQYHNRLDDDGNKINQGAKIFDVNTRCAGGKFENNLLIRVELLSINFLIAIFFSKTHSIVIRLSLMNGTIKYFLSFECNS